LTGAADYFIKVMLAGQKKSGRRKGTTPMSLVEDIARIPRKAKPGTRTRVGANLYLNPDTMEAVRELAKKKRVALNGLVELALVRMLSELDTAA
jgi:hypothetical protein